MLRLIYTSQAVEPCLIADICRESEMNNLRDEITGILLYAEGCFLQVMEGPKSTVEDTFLRIVVDKRHLDLLLLSRAIITRRQFGDWAMVPVLRKETKAAVLSQVQQCLEEAPPALRANFNDRFGEAATSRQASQRYDASSQRPLQDFGREARDYPGS